MPERFILGIDQSTSGTKALLFNSAGELMGRCDRQHEQKISPEGWISHDPMEIYRNTIAAAKDIFEKTGINKSAVIGAAISNQRETALAWDKKTGAPLCDAVVWQCSRASGICARLKNYADVINKKTGLKLSPYFSAAKIAWILEQTGRSDGIYAGTIDSWLVYKLTGNHKTDYSNASRTQLFNINGLCWDIEICDIFGIDPNILPEVCDSDALYGYTDFEAVLPDKIPIHAVLGDSHAAMFGHGCTQKGAGKITYGTGSSVMINIGESPVCYNEKLVTSLAWKLNGKINYVLEGNINYTGAVIKWLADDLGLIDSPKDAGIIAARANSADTTYLVPAFSGLGAPYWNNEARAIFCGMSRNTRKAELVKAAEECIAYQITDVIKEAEITAPIKITDLHVDGGSCADEFLMQFQSDICGISVIVPKTEEISGMGAAYAAGMTLGLYDDFVLIQKPEKVYNPNMSVDRRNIKYQGWLEAVKKSIN